MALACAIWSLPLLVPFVVLLLWDAVAVKRGRQP